MNKIIYTIFLCLVLLTTTSAKAIEILRVEPANWWTGMKNSELQVLVYGPDIARSALHVSYPGITLKEVAKTTNPNYVFIYLTISRDARPGNVPLNFTEGTQKFTYNYPLLARTDKGGALGFNASDV